MCTYRTFKALNNILGQQVLHQPSQMSMYTKVESICTHLRRLTLKHSTHEVPNTILHPKRLDQPT
jgi:hypothetical protein